MGTAEVKVAKQIERRAKKRVAEELAEKVWLVEDLLIVR